MNSSIWKAVIAAVIAVLSYCGNDPLPTLHPLFRLEAERVNDTSRVTMATTVPEHYSYYRIVNTACTLQVTYHALVNGADTVLAVGAVIANDSAAFQAGKFYGIWMVPDSLARLDTVRIHGCVSDEMKHEICGSLELSRGASLPE